MRIAQICPPWLAVPPKGYGGIEWVVSLIADGLVVRRPRRDPVRRRRLRDHREARVHLRTRRPGSAVDQRHHAGRHPHDVRAAGTRPSGSTCCTCTRPSARWPRPPRPPCPPCTRCTARSPRRCPGSTRRWRDRAWFVAISEAQRRTNESLRYAGVVYNGIDVERYPFSADKDDYLLFLGRAAPEKGWRRAVETARLTGRRLISAVEDRPSHRAGGVGAAHQAHPARGLRGAWGDLSRAEGRSALPRAGRAVPHRLGGAVRAGDDGGHGVRDPGDRDAQRIRPRGDRRRRDRVDRERRAVR